MTLRIDQKLVSFPDSFSCAIRRGVSEWAGSLEGACPSGQGQLEGACPRGAGSGGREEGVW